MKYLKEENIAISQIKINVKVFIKILKLIEADECTQNDGKRILQMICKEDEVLIDEAIKKLYQEKISMMKI